MLKCACVPLSSLSVSYSIGSAIMESYIGERVLVTLRDPPDTQVNGIVTEIIGQELCLRDGETCFINQSTHPNPSLQ